MDKFHLEEKFEEFSFENLEAYCFYLSKIQLDFVNLCNESSQHLAKFLSKINFRSYFSPHQSLVNLFESWSNISFLMKKMELLPHYVLIDYNYTDCKEKNAIQKVCQRLIKSLFIFPRDMLHCKVTNGLSKTFVNIYEICLLNKA